MSTAQATLEAMISAQHTHAEQECAELRHALPLDWQVVPDGSGSGFRVEVVLEAHLSLAIFRDVSFACNSRRSI